ncbi:MAG TPA: CBS domain-containing protein, partial [Candidatus Limnocylindria bacterium]
MEIDGIGYALLVDAANRPLGWVNRDELTVEGALSEEEATPGAPLLQPETTLRDALSALLGSSVQLGVVTDERDRVLGLLSVDAISDVLRNDGTWPRP